MAVVRDVGPLVPEGVHFVPGHPVAGSEKSGPDAGFAELFRGRFWLLTPEDGVDPAATAKVEALWSRVGAIVEVMDAAYHDKVLALTSHLPHLIAYTIVGTAFDVEEQERQDVIRFSAGGFRDFTRIAGSDPTMWRGHLPEQQGSRAGDATALHRGSDRAAAADPLGRRRQALRVFSSVRGKSGAGLSTHNRKAPIPGGRVPMTPSRRQKAENRNRVKGPALTRPSCAETGMLTIRVPSVLLLRLKAPSTSRATSAASRVR